MGQCFSSPRAAEALADAPGTAAAEQRPTNGEAQSAAWAYQGAPRPHNEAERLGLLRALGVLDSESEGPDPFDAITRLLCAVFNVPIALVSLVDAERQWFKSVQGLGTCMQTSRSESFCAWTLLPDSPYVLIVEDAKEDKRFRENPLVAGQPGIRFYAGAPLISSANGYRYGTLCVIDTAPRHEFVAEQYNMLIQFAELCVREIEKDKLMLLQKLVQQSAVSQPRSEVETVSPLGSLPGSLRTSGARSVTPAPSVRAAAQAAAQHKGEGEARPQHWGLTRAVDCFREGVMLVDVSTPTWGVLYANDAFTSTIGVPRDEATSQGFWEIFCAPGQGPATFQEHVEASEPFTAAVALQTIYSTTPRATTVDFRPATTGQLGGQSQLIGIPASVASAGSQPDQQPARGDAPQPKLYFAIVRCEARKPPRPPSAPGTATAALAAGTGSGVSPFAALAASPSDVLSGSPSGPACALAQTPHDRRASMESQRSVASVSNTMTAFKRAMPSAFTDVRLGPLIGRGAYGRVYRGTWNGTTVAVKVIETTEPLDEWGEGLAPGKSGIFEAVLSSNLSHPNIVHTYQYAFRPVSAEDADDTRVSTGTECSSGSKPLAANKPATEVWLVSEFCNRGPLLTAIERGAFLTQPSSQYGQPNLISVLQTLQEVAAALQYLHRNDVLHGDLTGGNVLLTASDKDTRGFTAKVVDFGLSRVCSGDYLRTRTLGCAEYMPPELITDGILTKAADVYAFGVICWEMYCGRRAWDGLKPTEVLRRVASATKLEFPPQTPHRLKILGERCMDYAPSARPTMEDVLSEVNSILSDTMGILQQFLAASSAGGGAGAGAARASTVSELQPSDPFR